MERIIWIVTRSVCFICLCLVYLFTNPSVTYVKGNDSLDAHREQYIYFYVTPCELCEKAKETLDQIQWEGSPDILRLDLYEEGNLALYYTLAESNQIPSDKRQTPVLFYEGGYTTDFSYESIANILSVYQGIYMDSIGHVEEDTITRYSASEFLMLFGVGLLNGFNPCSISMILLLFSLISSKKLNTLKLGLSFVLGKFVAYFAIGLLFYDLLASFDGGVFKSLSRIVTIAVICISLMLAIFYFLDFLAARHGQYERIRVQLPRGMKDFNQRLIQGAFKEGREKLFLMVAFILALVISAGEFLCTGQIYLATIVYLLQSTGGMDITVMFLFLIYVTGMIIPYLVVTVLAARGKRVFELSEFFRRNLPWIKLSGAFLFLCFAVYLITVELSF